MTPCASTWYPAVQDRPWAWPSALILCPTFMRGLTAERATPELMAFVHEVGTVMGRLGFPCTLSPGRGWVTRKGTYTATGPGEEVYRAVLACARWMDTHGEHRDWPLSYLLVRRRPEALGTRLYVPPTGGPEREVLRMFDVQTRDGQVLCVHPHLDHEQIVSCFGWDPWELHRAGSDAQPVWRHLSGLSGDARAQMVGQFEEAVQALQGVGQLGARDWQLTWLAVPGGFRLWAARDLRAAVRRRNCPACRRGVDWERDREAAYAEDPMVQKQEPIRKKCR